MAFSPKERLEAIGVGLQAALEDLGNAAGTAAEVFRQLGWLMEWTDPVAEKDCG